MRNRLWTTPCVSAFCLALTALPTNAGSSRLSVFDLTCDGVGRIVLFNATGFPASTNQFILGGEVALPRGVTSLRLSVPGDPTKMVLIMGGGEVSARFAMPTFYQVTSNASGNIPMQVGAACGGGGQIRGTVLLIFN